MPSLGPIHWKKFDQFLTYVGCTFVRQKGDHRVYWRDGLLRPIILRTKKDVPIFEIKSNLRTLSISTEEYLSILERL
mgnify:CR=1 FL=1